MSGALRHNPADIIRYFLIAKGVGVRPSAGGEWPVYADFIPDGPNIPDEVLCVFDTKPKTQGRIQVTGEVQEFYGINIQIRCKVPSEGKYLGSQIIPVLDTNKNITVTHPDTANTYLISAITRKSGVLGLGKESSGALRNLFSINAIASIRQVT